MFECRFVKDNNDTDMVENRLDNEITGIAQTNVINDAGENKMEVNKDQNIETVEQYNSYSE